MTYLLTNMPVLSDNCTDKELLDEYLKSPEALTATMRKNLLKNVRSRTPNEIAIAAPNNPNNLVIPNKIAIPNSLQCQLENQNLIEENVKLHEIIEKCSRLEQQMTTLTSSGYISAILSWDFNISAGMLVIF